MSGLERRDRWHKTAGVDPTAWHDFAPGDRVMTVEGLLGTVTAVEDGPYAGAEQYIVTLDAGLGGGEYSPGELRPLEGTRMAGRKTAFWLSHYGEVPDPENLHTGAYTIAEDHCSSCGSMDFEDLYRGDQGYTACCNKTPCFGLNGPLGRGAGVFGVPQKSVLACCWGAVERAGWNPPEGSSKLASKTEADLHTAADDYPELSDILTERPPLEHAIPVEALSKNAGPWTKLKDRYTDYVENRLPSHMKHQPGTAPSYDWCRFRKNQRCMFPKEMNVVATQEAGYAVWVPEDRGWCPRHKWEDQEDCPVSEPGPRSGHPQAMLDATIPWEEGGQRGGVPVGDPYKKAASLTKEAWAWPDGTYITWEEEQRIGEEAGLFPEGLGNLKQDKKYGEISGRLNRFFYDKFIRGEVIPKTEVYNDDLDAGAKPNWFDRMPVAASIDHDFLFHVTAGWRDVQTKAKRIRSEQGVRIVSASPQYLVGEVRGDTNLYESGVEYVPGTRQIALWTCGCAWANYSWGRSGRWKKFEGRMCSHALALAYEAQARGMFGKEVTEDVDRQMRRDPTVPVIRPGDYRTKPGPWRVGKRQVCTDPLLNHSPLVLFAEGMLSEGRSPNDVMTVIGDERIVAQAMSMSFRDLKAKVRNVVRRVLQVSTEDDTAEVEGVGKVPANEVLYPTYHPYEGLNFVGSRTAQADTDGVMVCIRPPEHICEALAELGTEDIDNLHVTLAYLGKQEMVDRDKLHMIVAEVADRFGQIMAKVGGFGVFLNGDENVLVALIDSPGMEDLQVHLTDALERAGLPVHHDHGYQPHLTLAYTDDDADIPPGVPDGAAGAWPVVAVTVSYGEEWVPFPLTGLAKAAGLGDLADEQMTDLSGWDINDTPYWDAFYQPQVLFERITADDPPDFSDPLATPEYGYLGAKEAVNRSDEMPRQAPDTAPIPPGHHRLTHRTPMRNADAIRREGLGAGYSTQIEFSGEMVWGTAGFHHSCDVQNAAGGDFCWVEYHVEWDKTAPAPRPGGAYTSGSIPPSQIIAIWEPWHLGVWTLAQEMGDRGGLEQFEFIRNEGEGWRKAYDWLQRNQPPAWTKTTPIQRVGALQAEAGAAEGLDADLVRIFRGRHAPDTGEKVYVYRDLSNAPKSGYPQDESWSIKQKPSGDVIAHTQGLRIKNVRPAFLEGARKQFQKKIERGVHAFLEGEVDDYVATPPSGRAVTYFPDISVFFFKDNRKEFMGASAITFSYGKCIAEGGIEGKDVMPRSRFEPCWECGAARKQPCPHEAVALWGIELAASKAAACPDCGSPDVSVHQDPTTGQDDIRCHACGYDEQLAWDEEVADLDKAAAWMIQLCKACDGKGIVKQHRRWSGDTWENCKVCGGTGLAPGELVPQRIEEIDLREREMAMAAVLAVEEELKDDPEPALPGTTAEEEEAGITVTCPSCALVGTTVLGFKTMQCPGCGTTFSRKDISKTTSSYEPVEWAKWHEVAEDDPDAEPDLTEGDRPPLALSSKNVCPGEGTRAWLMTGAGAGGKGGGSGPSDGDIAAQARRFLKEGMKVFTPAEQAELINEGEGVTASNLDRLDLEGTHYIQVEEALRAEEEEEEVMWLM